MAEKKSISLYTDIKLDTLLSELPYNLEHNALIDFILELDANVADMNFTNVLIMKLRQTLEEENIPLGEQVFELQETIRRASVLLENSSELLNRKIWADDGEDNGTDSSDDADVPETDV